MLAYNSSSVSPRLKIVSKGKEVLDLDKNAYEIPKFLTF
jgi:hypothetical protein